MVKFCLLLSLLLLLLLQLRLLLQLLLLLLLLLLLFQTMKDYLDKPQFKFKDDLANFFQVSEEQIQDIQPQCPNNQPELSSGSCYLVAVAFVVVVVVVVVGCLMFNVRCFVDVSCLMFLV